VQYTHIASQTVQYTHIASQTVQYTHSTSLDCAVHTRTTGKYAAITPTMSISTDEIEPLQ